MSAWYVWFVQTGDLSGCSADQLKAVEEVYHAHGAFLKRGHTVVSRSGDEVVADSRGDFQVDGDPNEKLLGFARRIREAAGFDVEVKTAAWFDDVDPDFEMEFKRGRPLPVSADEYEYEYEDGDDV
jgi:hypothetical protein